ncbi:MAG TPA: urea transporter [Polyangiaceae bacterium]
MAALIERARALGSRGLALVDAVLGAYASLLFSRSRVTGALLLAATAWEPQALILGLAALAGAALLSAGMGLGREALTPKPYGYNALLVGLGVAHGFALEPASLGVALLGGALAVLVGTALGSLASKLGEPPLLSLPFIAVAWILGGCASLLGLTPALASAPASVFTPEGLLGVFGLLVFLPRPEVGALVLLALLVHSRIATLLAGLAVALVLLLGRVAPDVLFEPLAPALALNAFLAAMAVGAVWFVPSRSSFAAALFASLASTALVASMARPLGALGLAPLILPFNLSVLLVLFAARQRPYDRSPRSVDFSPGSPEENLAYVETRRARFRALYGIEFRLPFRGAWVCTQGVDGTLTHQGSWRHAFDFEVQDAEGRRFARDGATPDDHFCHRLPVLAVADGTVVKVEMDVPDNAVGGLELQRNWGNVVVLHHAPGLFSLVAHLAQGSARVAEGNRVRRGDVLGLCGNSGRSPRPHLHFQLQGTAALGAVTLPCTFSDAACIHQGAERVAPARTPREGEVLRNLAPDEARAAFLSFPVGATSTYRVAGRTETLEHDLDLYGQRLLRSRELGAALYFATTEEGLTAYEALGARRSVVHLLRKALGRVLFDTADALVWSDHLPARATGHVLLRPLRDLVAPFVPSAGLEMEYRAVRADDGDLEIVGRSLRTRRRGAPLVQTYARLSRAHGVVTVEVEERGRTRRVDRLDDRGEPMVFARSSRRSSARRLESESSSLPSPLETFRSQPGES